MKRLLALAAAVPVAAILLIPASGNAQNALDSIVRAEPVQVTNTTLPRRDRFRPYTFTTTGRVIPPTRYCNPGENPGTGTANCVPILCPPGVTDIRYCLRPGRSVICTGTVTVRVQKRGTTISSRNVLVNPDCTYRSRVTFRTRLRSRTGFLSFRARFGGNAVLLPRNSSTRTARAG